MSSVPAVLDIQPLTPVSSAANFLPLMTLAEAKGRRDLFVQFVKEIMVDGVDYGTVPGSTKPTLMKPGAEKLSTLFGLVPTFEIVERVEDWTGKDHGEPFFYYFYKCRLWRGDRCQGEGDGSCNSMESKYRFRWVPAHEVPAGSGDKLKTRGGKRSEFAFAIEKAETTGQYGKPIEYWREFITAIENKTAAAIKKPTRSGKQMDAWEIDATLYRVPNDDIPDQVNTIQKMAQKRAYVAATLVAVNASEFFTQDIEEMDSGLEASAPVAAAQAATVPSGKGEEPAPDDLKKQAIQAFKAACETLLIYADSPDRAERLAEFEDFLRYYLGSDDLGTVDPHSIIAKCQQVGEQERKKKGAAAEWVKGTALEYRKRKASQPQTPAPAAAPAATEAPPAGPKKAEAPSLTMMYAGLARKFGRNGVKTVNAYLDAQLGHHGVAQLKFGTPKYVRFAGALLGLDELDDAALRQALTGEESKKPPREPGDESEEDMFGQEKRQ